MKIIEIDLMPDSSELVHYDNPNIPLYIRKTLLSNYYGQKAVCHWHNDLEIILILSGKMNYYVDGETLLLKEGEAILINSQKMHYGYSTTYEDCEFICILFSPSLLSSNQFLYQNMFEPFFNTSNIPFLKLTLDKHAETIDTILQIWKIKETKNSYYELNIISLLYSFMASLLRNFEDILLTNHDAQSKNALILRKMISFIHENYKSSLSLQDISASANICKSKCCFIFQEQIQQSPIDFLNTYRLKKSAILLKSTKLSITEIALDCGFNHSSYYSKLFYRLYQCTPREFRYNIENNQLS